MRSVVAALTLLTLGLSSAPSHLFVVCSPGSPGTTAEAQPTMNVFAAALTAKTHLSIAAVYDEAEEAGVARLRAENAAIALVSLPFFLKHEHDLGLRARLQAIPKGRSALERWTLVAKKGRIHTASELEGFTVVSSVGFAPAFVRGPALGKFGSLPASARVVQSAAVLSALRRAATGEPVAVLLDEAQDAALPSLPFASELEAVTRSAPMPAGVVAEVVGRLRPEAWSALDEALRSLGSDGAGLAALEVFQTTRFVAVDDQALADARKAYTGAAR